MMAANVGWAKTVGVAPGTTTLQIGLGNVYWNPYNDLISLNDAAPRDSILTDRPIRWDLVGIIGGGSMLVALTAAFLASAFRR